MLNIVNTPLDVVKAIGSAIKGLNAANKSSSLTDFTASTRVEPIVAIDEKVAYLPYTEEILKTVLAIFSAQYLQAVSLSLNIGKIDTIKLFDHLNPNRKEGIGMKDVAEALESTSFLLNEDSYKNGLPKIRRNPETFSLESVRDDIRTIKKDIETGLSGDKEVWVEEGRSGTSRGVGVDKKGFEVLETGNLAVGCLLEVHVESEGHRTNIPVMVRLAAQRTRSEILTAILGKSTRDISLMERFRELTSGEIKFWKDFVLNQDLVDEHRATLMKDNTGLYAEILNRRQKSRTASWISGRPSVAEASTITILSSQTARQIEAHTGYKLSNFKARQRMFLESYNMLIIEVDTEWEQVTIYHRGISIPTTISVKNMKVNNKGKGVDVAEILKAYQLGQAPSFS